MAVCGTVNDLAMNGAIPQYLSCGLILEEGLAFEELDEILRTMSVMAKAANVQIVTGDTKVVKKGEVDKIYINTAWYWHDSRWNDIGPHRESRG
ncbi:MAG: AIR synthase related protein [Veillonella parvula]